MRLPNFKKRNTSGLSKFQSKTARVQIPSWKHVNWAHSPPSPCQSTTVQGTTSPLTNASARHYINASEGGGRLSDSAPFLHVVHFSRLMYTGRWVALLRCLLRPTHAASLTPQIYCRMRALITESFPFFPDENKHPRHAWSYILTV